RSWSHIVTIEAYEHYNSIQCAVLSHYVFSTATATTQHYTLSLHDALPISPLPTAQQMQKQFCFVFFIHHQQILLNCLCCRVFRRSEEHKSELQSRENLVCRLLLEKKKDVSFIIYALLCILFNCNSTTLGIR